VPCAFDLDWVVRVIERMLDHQSEDFRGMLFCLYMGDRLAAAMVCVRSRNLLHGSVLGYDRELSRYAPGFVLVMRMAQMVIGLGVTRVDMGSGGEEYKDKLASGCEKVAEGTVPAQPLLAPVYRGLFRTKDRLRGTRLRTPVRAMRAWLLATRARLGYSD
jgi:CelD/BcsL family acetyltransferase involved in cellulose biosynthesis